MGFESLPLCPPLLTALPLPLRAQVLFSPAQPVLFLWPPAVPALPQLRRRPRPHPGGAPGGEGGSRRPGRERGAAAERRGAQLRRQRGGGGQDHGHGTVHRAQRVVRARRVTHTTSLSSHGFSLLQFSEDRVEPGRGPVAPDLSPDDRDRLPLVRGQAVTRGVRKRAHCATAQQPSIPNFRTDTASSRRSSASTRASRRRSGRRAPWSRAGTNRATSCERENNAGFSLLYSSPGPRRISFVSSPLFFLFQ